MADLKQNVNLQKELNNLIKEAKQGDLDRIELQDRAVELAEKIVELGEKEIDNYERKKSSLSDFLKNMRIGDKLTNTVSFGFNKMLGAVSSLGGVVKGALLGGLASVGGIVTGIFIKAYDIIKSVDEASSNLVKTAGILDSSFNRTLIQATESSALLGGNIQLVAEYAAELVSNLSPSISLTSELIGNVAQVGERFQIGADNAAKLTQIVSELTNTTFEEASGRVEGLIESTGRLGIAVAKDLAQSYDSVIDRFGIGLESLKQQTLQAVQLGLSISKVADISEGLLDFQSSISSEFKASAILGQQINLQKARQLAFEGNIVGALNETLDRVESIGDFEKLSFFQRKAIAEATGLSVSELQKELNLRRQIGVQGRIDAATRETALGKFEEINRRIQAALFKVLASPSIQQAFDNFANSVISFLQSPRFNQIVSKLSMAVDFLGDILGGGKEFKFNLLKGTAGLQDVDDAVITPQGDVIRTNPRDFIIATQTPQTLIQPNDNSQMMVEMVSLLRDLRQNGVQSVVNLDGKRVSTALTNRVRY